MQKTRQFMIVWVNLGYNVVVVSYELKEIVVENSGSGRLKLYVFVFGYGFYIDKTYRNGVRERK